MKYPISASFLFLLVSLWAIALPALAEEPPAAWLEEWPKTDFARSAVPFAEILSGGPAKDGIPAIDNPKIVGVGEATDLTNQEPVIAVVIEGAARAYPLRVLIWHEIANDELGGVPIAVTFCPLCNSAIVFDRRLGNRTLDFGTTGKLRLSDLVMYDRQTESWWQQFVGEAIIGEMTGERLAILPSRLESWGEFKKRAPDGTVLMPADAGQRLYGVNPYAGYDDQGPFGFYKGPFPEGIAPMARVISLADRKEGWSLTYLQKVGEIVTADGITLRWRSTEQTSALDTEWIPDGRLLGTVTATRAGTGGPEDVAVFVEYAFAFHAFFPQAPIHHAAP